MKVRILSALALASLVAAVVDLYDASTKKMVWRGVATGSVSSRPSRNTRRLDRAITRMFERYPPRAASAN